MKTQTVKQTIRGINKENPGVYVLVSREFGEPIFIAPLKHLQIQPCFEVEEAQKWTYADTLSVMKLGYHKAVTGLNGLVWEKI